MTRPIGNGTGFRARRINGVLPLTPKCVVQEPLDGGLAMRRLREYDNGASVMLISVDEHNLLE